MNEHVTGTGQLIINVHDWTICAGQFCVIHNPSDHHMVRWKTSYRIDRRRMERLCAHGIAHPDPDDLEHLKRAHGRNALEFFNRHQCDGCCSFPAIMTGAEFHNKLSKMKQPMILRDWQPIRVITMTNVKHQLAWVSEHIHFGHWTRFHQCLLFEDDRDAMHFKLRWLV